MKRLEALLAQMERVHEITESEEGMFKVIGIDKFDGMDWVEGEYPTAKEALGVARQKTKDASSLASDHSVATVYYAYDPDGKYLRGEVWNDE